MYRDDIARTDIDQFQGIDVIKPIHLVDEIAAIAQTIEVLVATPGANQDIISLASVEHVIVTRTIQGVVPTCPNDRWGIVVPPNIEDSLSVPGGSVRKLDLLNAPIAI